jgi:hypothetical protein
MTTLVKYDAVCKAIAAAKSIDEVKGIRNKAEAIRAYARQAKNKSLEVDAAEIRVRAERRLGQMIRAQKTTAGLAPPGPKPKIGSKKNPNTTLTLAQIGVDKSLIVDMTLKRFAR